MLIVSALSAPQVSRTSQLGHLKPLLPIIYLYILRHDALDPVGSRVGVGDYDATALFCDAFCINKPLPSYWEKKDTSSEKRLPASLHSLKHSPSTPTRLTWMKYYVSFPRDGETEGVSRAAGTSTTCAGTQGVDFVNARQKTWAIMSDLNGCNTCENCSDCLCLHQRNNSEFSMCR